MFKESLILFRSAMEDDFLHSISVIKCYNRLLRFKNDYLLSKLYDLEITVSVYTLDIC